MWHCSKESTEGQGTMIIIAWGKSQQGWRQTTQPTAQTTADCSTAANGSIATFYSMAANKSKTTNSSAAVSNSTVAIRYITANGPTATSDATIAGSKLNSRHSITTANGPTIASDAIAAGSKLNSHHSLNNSKRHDSNKQCNSSRLQAQRSPSAQ